MDQNNKDPPVESLKPSEPNDDDLFTSQFLPKTRSSNIKASQTIASGSTHLFSQNANRENSEDENPREASLRKELAGVRNVNKALTDVLDSLEHAKTNMDAVSRTVSNASNLLNTWTRILSQTEHNQRLILNPHWHGASQDMADLENEDIAKQQEKDRQKSEELQRRELNARKAEEEERKRAETPNSRGTRASKGRSRGGTRGAPGRYARGSGQEGARRIARAEVNAAEGVRNTTSTTRGSASWRGQSHRPG